MNRENTGWGAFFIIGAFVGAFLALMFGTDENGNTKKSVKVKVKQTKDGMREFKEEHIDPVVEVFGEKTREARAKFDAAIDNMENRLSQIKGNLSELDRAKYDEIVAEVVADMKKTGSYTTEQLGKLRTYLANDYQQLTSTITKKIK